MSLARKPQSLKDERARLFTEAEGMLDRLDDENRNFTTAEKKRYNELLSSIESTTKMIELQSKQGAPGQPGADTDIFHENRSTPAGQHLGKLTAFASAQDAYRSGRWIMAQLLGDQSSARWCQDAGMPLMAASEGLNASGGYLVPSELSSSILALLDTYSVARQECRVVGMGSDTLDVPRRDSGLLSYFVGEGSEITESDGSWSNVKLTAKKLACLTRMSSEIQEDSIIDLASWLAQEVAWSFSEKEENCLFNGDGSAAFGGMEGLTNQLINGNFGASAISATAGSNTFAEIDGDDLSQVMAALPAYAQRNAKWYCSPVAWSLVFQSLMQAGGGSTIVDLSRAVPRQYLGYPVVISP